jgi:hypothetical protein
MRMEERMSRVNSIAWLWGAAAAGLVSAAGCAGNTTSERNSAVPIPAGATVQFRGRTTSGTPGGNTAAANDTVHRQIQQAIIAQQKAKGYTVVDTTTAADFTVRYFLSVKTSADSYGQTGGGVTGPQRAGYGSGYGYGRTADTEYPIIPPPDTIRTVSFEVSLVDEKAGRTAWRGLLEREPRSGTPTEKRINEVVAEVCRSLPAVP